jgi:integrase
MFAATCGREHIEDLNRKDILAFTGHLRGKSRSERTVANHLSYLKIFFAHYSQPWPMLKTDRVKYTEKLVAAYTPGQVRAMLTVADQEESDLVHFFVATGARDLEVVFATWRDISFTERTFSVREKLDLGWKPKDGEERVVPMPDTLVELLTARRKRMPGTRLIFPSKSGGPDLHMLRVVKRLALQAGLNCGHCEGGRSCAQYPICNDYGLHKFRKTFGTLHHEAGVSVRTIQRWLSHTDLETTLKYLAASDDKSEKTRELVNSTFAQI